MISTQHTKLTSIYQALDNHQYTRAIKLASAAAIPHNRNTQNLMVFALMANAYAKSQQTYKALLILYGLMGNFPELEREIQCSLESRDQKDNGTAQTKTTSSAAAAKKGKKGKKKSGATSGTSNNDKEGSGPLLLTATPEHLLPDWELIEQLDRLPTLPEDWKDRPTGTALVPDCLLLETLHPTLINLKLTLTAFQMWEWASRTSVTNEPTFYKQIVKSGLAVLMTPGYANLPVLPTMQKASMQFAREDPLGTLWAAQICLWQLDMADEINDPSFEQSKPLLPRLAASMAFKALNCDSPNVPASEAFILYIKALCAQNKQEESLKAIEERLSSEVPGQPLCPPKSYLLNQKLELLLELKRFKESEDFIAGTLLKNDPDNWHYWKSYLHSLRGAGVQSEKLVALAQSVCLEEAKHCRGPALVQVEFAFDQWEQDMNSETLQAFGGAIRAYWEKFSRKCSCAFEDLRPYVTALCKNTGNDVVRDILDFECCSVPLQEDETERKEALRQYIFSIKLNFLVRDLKPEICLRSFQDWKSVIRVWVSLQQIECADQVQREIRVSDELILLAVQEILSSSVTLRKRMIAICLLFSAIAHSPHNSYLKIAAINELATIGASSKGFQLYNEIHAKHIQHESFSFVVLEGLFKDGQLVEAVSLSQDILRFHMSFLKESIQYSTEALENGTMSQAGDFLTFQRTRMNNSLISLDSKGIILDCAPFLTGGSGRSLGTDYGIVGSPTDLQRAKTMITGVENFSSSFSLLRFGDGRFPSAFSDNRDLDIFSYTILGQQPLYRDSTTIFADSRRRSLCHSLLVKAALCAGACRGARNAKIFPPSPEEIIKSRSLISAVEDIRKIASYEADLSLSGTVRNIIASLAEIIAILLAGSTLPGLEDCYESRESAVFEKLQESISVLKRLGETAAITNRRDSCVFISSYAIHCFALLRLCGNTFESFGWTRRKILAKRCSGAFTDLVMLFSGLLRDTMNASTRYDVLQVLPDVLEDVQGLLSESSVQSFFLDVSRSQQVDNIFLSAFDEMCNELDDFN